MRKTDDDKLPVFPKTSSWSGGVKAPTTLLFGAIRYQYTGEVNAGSFAKVKYARGPDGNELAIKILQQSRVSRRTGRWAENQECTPVQRLLTQQAFAVQGWPYACYKRCGVTLRAHDKANKLTVTAVGIKYYQVMERVPGKNVYILNRRNSFSAMGEAQRLQKCLQLLNQLLKWHGAPAPMVHGDVHTGNAVWGEEEARWVDLGLVYYEKGLGSTRAATGYTQTCFNAALLEGKTPSSDYEAHRGNDLYGWCQLVSEVLPELVIASIVEVADGKYRSYRFSLREEGLSPLAEEFLHCVSECLAFDALKTLDARVLRAREATITLGKQVPALLGKIKVALGVISVLPPPPPPPVGQTLGARLFSMLLPARRLVRDRSDSKYPSKGC